MTRAEVERKCFAADGKTPTYTYPGVPILVPAAAFNALRAEVARLRRANAEAQMANGFYSAALERIFTTPHNGDEASKRMCAIAQRAINTVAYTGTAPLAGDGGDTARKETK